MFRLENGIIIDGPIQIGTDQGTTGEVLTSQGAGLPPVWGTTTPATMAAFNATRGGTQQDSGTTIIFNTTLVDVLGDYDDTTGEFTAPADGWYNFTTTCQFVNSTGASLGIQVQIEVNGSVVAAESAHYDNGVTYSASTSVNVLLTSGDVVKVTSNTALSANFVLTVSGRTRFTGIMVR